MTPQPQFDDRLTGRPRRVEDDPQLVHLTRRQTNYVPAAPARPAAIVPAIPPASYDLAQPLQPAAVSIVQDRSDDLTRAKSHVLYTIPLAFGLAVVTTASVLTLASQPILSALTLITFFGTAAGVWLASFVYYVSRSPAGNAHYHTRQMWRTIREEQRFRHDVYWDAIERQDHHDR